MHLSEICYIKRCDVLKWGYPACNPHKQLNKYNLYAEVSHLIKIHLVKPYPYSPLSLPPLCVCCCLLIIRDLYLNST